MTADYHHHIRECHASHRYKVVYYAILQKTNAMEGGRKTVVMLSAVSSQSAEEEEEKDNADSGGVGWLGTMRSRFTTTHWYCAYRCGEGNIPPLPLLALFFFLLFGT